MADFLSNLSDADLVNVAQQLYETFNAEPSNFGTDLTQTTDLQAKKDSFTADLTAHVAAQAMARSNTQAKDASRDVLEAAIRFLVKQAKLNGAKDEDLALAGVPVGAVGDPATNATRPVGNVDTSQRFRHTINFADESAPDKKRNPRGVVGCEIYMKIGGAPPADVSECSFVALDTKTPYVYDFDAEDVGKMVHYMLRWRLRDESTSPWSETISATVTG